MAADKMTYHEAYGDVSEEQLRLYKRNNVSSSDHDELVNIYGSDATGRAKIIAAVRKFSSDGLFRIYMAQKAALEEAGG